MASSPSLRNPGEYVAHRMLGTEAVYRVVAPIGEGLLEVEVISAPGLEGGTRMRLTRVAVEQMTVVQGPRNPGPSGRFNRASGNPPSPPQRLAEPTDSAD